MTKPLGSLRILRFVTLSNCLGRTSFWSGTLRLGSCVRGEFGFPVTTVFSLSSSSFERQDRCESWSGFGRLHLSIECPPHRLVANYTPWVCICQLLLGSLSMSSSDTSISPEMSLGRRRSRVWRRLVFFSERFWIFLNRGTIVDSN